MIAIISRFRMSTYSRNPWAKRLEYTTTSWANSSILRFKPGSRCIMLPFSRKWVWAWRRIVSWCGISGWVFRSFMWRWLERSWCVTGSCVKLIRLFNIIWRVWTTPVRWRETRWISWNGWGLMNTKEKISSWTCTKPSNFLNCSCLYTRSHISSSGTPNTYGGNGWICC